MDNRFKLLQIKAKEQVHTLLSGEHLSKLYGDGYDFNELREYQMGDDIRKINWNISAKLQKPYIKELNSNRELSIVVVSLLDGSLYFNNSHKKQHLMTQIASILSYATQYNNDLFTGINYYEESIFSTNPTKQIFQIERYIKEIYNKNILYTKLNRQKSIDNLFKRVYKPSLIFILDDFLDSFDLSTLSQKHEVVAIIIRDDLEQNPKPKQEIQLINPQTNKSKNLFLTKNNISNYIKKLNQNDDRVIRHLSKHNIRYTKILTNDNIITKLINL